MTKKAPGNRPLSGEATQFQPGKSGNPSGRPAGYAEFRALCRTHSDAAVARLVSALDSDDDNAAISAAKVILDHGWGKPKQQLEVEGSIDRRAPSLADMGLSQDEIVDLARRALERKK